MGTLLLLFLQIPTQMLLPQGPSSVPSPPRGDPLGGGSQPFLGDPGLSHETFRLETCFHQLSKEFSSFKHGCHTRLWHLRSTSVECSPALCYSSFRFQIQGHLFRTPSLSPRLLISILFVLFGVLLPIHYFSACEQDLPSTSTSHLHSGALPEPQDPAWCGLGLNTSEQNKQRERL